MTRARGIQTLWLSFMMLAIVVLTQATQFSSDLTFFLPKSSEVADRVMVEQMREGPLSRFLLIALSGGSRENRLAASRALRTQLATSSHIKTLANGARIEWLDQLTAHLFPYRFVLNPKPSFAADAYTTPRLREALDLALDRLETPAGYRDERWLWADPLGEWRTYLESLGQRGHTLQTDEGLFVSASGDAALLMAVTQSSGFDIKGQAEAQDDVRAAFDTIQGHEQLSLTLGGPGVLSTETNSRISREAGLISGLTLLLVTALLFYAYRSARIIGLSMLPLAFGIVTGALSTRLVFGEVHTVTAAFAGTLLGVSADYPNHFFSHIDGPHREAISMNRIWPTLRLGILTNVIGFAAMLFSGFDGLQQLAVFATSGLIGAGLTTRFLLPTFAIERPPITERRSRIAERLLGYRWPPSLQLMPAWLSLGLVAMAFFSKSPLFKDDLALLNPVAPERLEQDVALQKAFGVPDLSQLLIVVGPTTEAALQAVEAIAAPLRALKSEGVIGNYELLSRWLPSQRAQQQRIEALPDRTLLLEIMRQATRGLPFKPDAFERFIKGVNTAKTLPPLVPGDFEGTPLELRIKGLLAPIDGGTAVIIPLMDIRDPDRVRTEVTRLDPQHVFFIDTQKRATELLKAYRHEAMGYLAIGLVFITIALRLGLGSFGSTMRILAPVLLAGLSTASLMAILSEGLNLYHFVALLLVMGLSLDQALFFNKPAKTSQEHFRTVLALIICSMSAITAFGCLAFSSVGLLRAIGLTVSSGASFAILFSALLANSTTTSR